MGPLEPVGAIRVTIVDDERPVRDGLALLIDATPGFCCTGVFADLAHAAPAIDADPPDVVLVDPGPSGAEGIRGLCTGHPDLCVVILTVYEDDDRTFDALCDGACGSVSKKTAPEGLLRCVRRVARGGGLMSPETARRLLDRLPRSSDPAGAVDLDDDERLVLATLAQGCNVDTAAEELRTSVARLGVRIRRVYDKLHRSRAIAGLHP